MGTVPKVRIGDKRLGAGVAKPLLRSRQGESSLLTRPVTVIRPSAFDGVAF